MPKYLTRSIDVVIVVVLIVTLWRVIPRLQGAGSGGASAPSDIGLNAKLSIPNVHWRSDTRHVVLSISTSCPACNDSVAFYRALSDRLKAERDIRFITIAPQPLDNTRQWLVSHAIEPDEVIEIRDPASFGLSMVPTLLFVNGDGAVTDIMSRTLSPAEEAQVWSKLNGDSMAPLNNSYHIAQITERELSEMSSTDTPTVLDIRERAAYLRRHHDSSINIPSDELSTRARIELAERPIVIDCVEGSRAECARAARVLLSLNYPEVSLLMR